MCLSKKLPETNSSQSTWNWRVGRQSFPFWDGFLASVSFQVLCWFQGVYFRCFVNVLGKSLLGLYVVENDSVDLKRRQLSKANKGEKENVIHNPTVGRFPQKGNFIFQHLPTIYFQELCQLCKFEGIGYPLARSEPSTINRLLFPIFLQWYVPISAFSLLRSASFFGAVNQGLRCLPLRSHPPSRQGPHGYTIVFGYNLVSQFTDIITVWFVHSLLMGLGWYLKQSYLVQWNLVARKIFLIKCCIYSMILHYRFVITHVTYVHIHLLFSCWSFCLGKKATVLEISSLPFQVQHVQRRKKRSAPISHFLPPFPNHRTSVRCLGCRKQEKRQRPTGGFNRWSCCRVPRVFWEWKGGSSHRKHEKKSWCKIIQVDIVPCLFLQQMRYDMTWLYRACQPERSWNRSSAVRENSESPCLVSRASGKCRTEQESESKAAKPEKKAPRFCQKFSRLPKSYEVKVVGVVDGCRL